MPDAWIRSFQPDDLDALYDVCLQTGDAGQDATGQFADPRLLGHVFAAPYALFEPSLAWVLCDAEGVGGYVLGAVDSRAFEARLDAEWWPQLRMRYPDPVAAGIPPERWTPDERVAAWIHNPHRAPAELLADYPSHLHVDIVARLQGGGHGAELMATVAAGLAAAGSNGVHLVVRNRNERAYGFYRHIGYTELSRAADSCVLGRRL
jgi:GNAT superfamily N-acetyltransferase